MSMTNSVKQNNQITNPISVSKANVMKSVEFQNPLKEYKVTSNYGQQLHPITKKNRHHDGIDLKSRQARLITPSDGTHRVIMMAIERGKLQNLIIDNQVLQHHRAMAAVLGAILKLPPIKQALASEQVKSRYVETLINQYNNLTSNQQPHH